MSLDDDYGFDGWDPGHERRLNRSERRAVARGSRRAQRAWRQQKDAHNRWDRLGVERLRLAEDICQVCRRPRAVVVEECGVTYGTGTGWECQPCRIAKLSDRYACSECSAPYAHSVTTAPVGPLCFSCWHWASIAALDAGERVKACVIVDGEHFYVHADDAPFFGGFYGFGGREFRILFHDGREVVSRNLWTQGHIPAHWRDRLPDNAIFIRAKAHERLEF